MICSLPVTPGRRRLGWPDAPLAGAVNMAEWYLRRGDKVSGPYSKERVKEFADNGKVRPDDELAPSSTGPFRPASEVPGLLPEEVEDDSDEPRPARRSSKRRQGKPSSGTTVLIIACVIGGMLLLGCPIFIALLLPAVQQARYAARRSESKNNLKIQGLAFHNFNDTYKRFPPHNEAGKAGHSFFTGLLPYVEQASVYRRIDLTKEWDSAENREALHTRVPTYEHADVVAAQNASGQYGPAHYAGNQHLFSGRDGPKIGDFSDGLSNTFLVGEVRVGVKAWGDPGNVRDLTKGIGRNPDQFNPGPGYWQCLFGDGAARPISPDVDPAVLKAISTPNGGDRLPAGF